MLNEKRVKHMIRLASFEQNMGKEDSKIDSYYKKTYVGFNVMISLLWITLGYVALVGIIFLTYMEKLVENLTMSTIIICAGSAVVGYLFILFAYTCISISFYRKKYLNAKKNMKKLAKDLQTLERLYEREEA